MWAAAGEMGGEHVGEDVEIVYGVRWTGCEPF